MFKGADRGRPASTQQTQQTQQTQTGTAQENRPDTGPGRARQAAPRRGSTGRRFGWARRTWRAARASGR